MNRNVEVLEFQCFLIIFGDALKWVTKQVAITIGLCAVPLNPAFVYEADEKKAGFRSQLQIRRSLSTSSTRRTGIQLYHGCKVSEWSCEIQGARSETACQTSIMFFPF